MRQTLSLAARLLWAAGILVSVAFARSAAGLLLPAALVLGSFVASRRTTALVTLVPLALSLAAFAFVLNALLTPGEPALGKGLPVPTREGMALGVMVALRLAISGLAFAWVASTVRAGEALDELRGGVLRLFGRAGDALGLVLAVALRFGPLVLVEGQRLVRAAAQRAGRRPGLWIAPAVAVPLVLLAVRRADRLAFVLEARHFGTARRTLPRPRAWSWKDAGIVALAGGVALVTFAFRL